MQPGMDRTWKMDQRTSPRYQVTVPAIMRVNGVPGPYLVRILDVSTSGVRVTSPIALSPGAKISLRCAGVGIAGAGLEITGEVRYSRPVERGEFHVGVLAETVSGDEKDLVRLLAGPK